MYITTVYSIKTKKTNTQPLSSVHFAIIWIVLGAQIRNLSDSSLCSSVSKRIFVFPVGLPPTTTFSLILWRSHQTCRHPSSLHFITSESTFAQICGDLLWMYRERRAWRNAQISDPHQAGQIALQLPLWGYDDVYTLHAPLRCLGMAWASMFDNGALINQWRRVQRLPGSEE